MLAAESVVAHPEASALLFVVAGLSPEAVVSVAEPGAVSVVVDLEVVFAAEPGVAGLSPEAVVSVAEPGVASVDVDPEVVVSAAEPGVASVADVAGPQASVDTAVAFAVLFPVFVVVIEVDSPGRPKFLVFPNVDQCASSSSSAEAVG